MARFFITILIIAIVAGLGFVIYKYGVPIFQENFAPQTKKVYTWTDKDGVVHYSDSPVYSPDDQELSDHPEVEVKRYKDYGKGKVIIEHDSEGEDKKIRSMIRDSKKNPSKRKSSTSSSKRKKDGTFVDKMRQEKEDAIPDEKRTDTERAIDHVPGF